VVFVKARSFYVQNTYFACKKQSTLPLSSLHLHKYFMLFKILMELALTKLAYTKQLKISKSAKFSYTFWELSKGRQITVEI
jgi:hypothetical protein